MWVSIALAILTIANLVIPGYPSIVAAWMVAFILLMGLMITYQSYRNKTYNALIGDFRKGLETYRRVVASQSENSPMRLMTRFSRQDIGEDDKMGARAWNIMLEKTSVIDEILMWEVQNFAGILNEFDASTFDVKPFVTELTERTWKVIKWYHENVVCTALKMREEIGPHDKSLRQDFSKFRMFYNDGLKEIQVAREKMNEELTLGLKTDLRDLLLPEPE
jgi:hypothetical protein